MPTTCRTCGCEILDLGEVDETDPECFTVRRKGGNGVTVFHKRKPLLEEDRFCHVHLKEERFLLQRRQYRNTGSRIFNPVSVRKE